MAKKPLNVETLLSQSKHFWEAINSDDPLTCVLLATSYIEKWLAIMLHDFFVECGTANELLKHDGILGPLVHRARVARCLGLIEKPVAQNIERIGTIRNKFAHSNIPLAWDSPEIAKECRELIWPEAVAFTSTDPDITSLRQRFAKTDSPDLKFKTIAALTTTLLDLLARNTRRTKAPQPFWLVNSTPLASPSTPP